MSEFLHIIRQRLLTARIIETLALMPTVSWKGNNCVDINHACISNPIKLNDSPAFSFRMSIFTIDSGALITWEDMVINEAVEIL